MHKRALGLAAVVAGTAVLMPAAWAQESSPPVADPTPVETPSETPSDDPTEQPAPTPTPTPTPTTPSEQPSPPPEPSQPPTEPSDPPGSPSTGPDPVETPAADEPLPDPDAPLPDGPQDALPQEGETVEEAAERAAASARSWVRTSAVKELQRAETRVAELEQHRLTAEAELAAAQGAQQALQQAQGTAETGEAEARRALGNYARLAYTAGPSEWTWIEAFLDANGPQDAIRRASASQLLAERQDTEWGNAVDLVAALTAEREAADDRTSAAAAALDWSSGQAAPVVRQLQQIRGVLAAGGIAPPDGAAAVARECAGTAIPECEPSGWGEGGLTRDAVWLMRVIRQSWPEIEVVGGFRAADKYADHPTGRAVDVMVPDGGATAESAALGDEMAEHFMTNADQFGILYILWNQRVWVNGRDEPLPPQEWRVMENRGGATANHVDHLHISVSTGVSGSDIYATVAAAAAEN